MNIRLAGSFSSRYQALVFVLSHFILFNIMILGCNYVVTYSSCRIVLKSIGYKSVLVDGLPFDNQKGRAQMNSLPVFFSYFFVQSANILLCRISLVKFKAFSYKMQEKEIVLLISCYIYPGVVPNIEGRVISDDSKDPTLLENGLYVCGWLKRGPTGIIATNLYCAEETVSSLMLP